MIPYDHWVLDNFFPVEMARQLSKEFPDYNEPNWHWYNNPLENKKAKNSWYEFPQLTYQIFSHLNSCLLYTSPSPRDLSTSRMPSSA